MIVYATVVGTKAKTKCLLCGADTGPFITQHTENCKQHMILVQKDKPDYSSMPIVGVEYDKNIMALI